MSTQQRYAAMLEARIRSSICDRCPPATTIGQVIDLIQHAPLIGHDRVGHRFMRMAIREDGEIRRENWSNADATSLMTVRGVGPQTVHLIWRWLYGTTP